MKLFNYPLPKPLFTMLLFVVLMFSHLAYSDQDTQGVRNKLVIQVSTDDLRTQTIALNNAVNMQKIYGMDNIAIEIVAYGPGIDLVTEQSKLAARVKSLALQNIRFSACGNTMDNIAKKTGHRPMALEGVQEVKAGVSRIMELQQQGYAYVRP